MKRFLSLFCILAFLCTIALSAQQKPNVVYILTDQWRASVVDMGNRFRLLVNKVEALEIEHDMPNLPVARVLWDAKPDLQTAASAWILAGGAHHTGYSQNLSAEQLEDFVEMMDIEFLLIDKKTDLYRFKQELRWNDICYK